MPRYYYNTYDGVDIIDRGGVDFRDFEQARVEALRYAAGVIHEDAYRKRLGNAWRLDVTDTDGVVLFRLDLLTTNASVELEGGKEVMAPKDSIPHLSPRVSSPLEATFADHLVRYAQFLAGSGHAVEARVIMHEAVAAEMRSILTAQNQHPATG